MSARSTPGGRSAPGSHTSTRPKPKPLSLSSVMRAMRPKPTRPSVRPRRRNMGCSTPVDQRPSRTSAVVQPQAARDRQRQRHRVRTHLVGAVVRHVGHHDAALARGHLIDVVHADAVADDGLAVGSWPRSRAGSRATRAPAPRRHRARQSSAASSLRRQGRKEKRAPAAARRASSWS